jgi:DNA-binding MarR family transcriptional regulator
MSRRDDLLTALQNFGREHSNAEVMFHSAISERMGISAVEEKTLDLLEREGPLTAGELAAHTGLAPASVTGLIDRLVAKGFVRRAPNTADRRRVNVEIDRDHVGTFAELFAELTDKFAALYERYSESELELILGYLQHSARILTEATAGVTKSAAPGRS